MTKGCETWGLLLTGARVLFRRHTRPNLQSTSPGLRSQELERHIYHSATKIRRSYGGISAPWHSTVHFGAHRASGYQNYFDIFIWHSRSTRGPTSVMPSLLYGDSSTEADNAWRFTSVRIWNFMVWYLRHAHSFTFRLQELRLQFSSRIRNKELLAELAKPASLLHRFIFLKKFNVVNVITPNFCEGQIS